jgi:hypothetical protein
VFIEYRIGEDKSDHERKKNDFTLFVPDGGLRNHDDLATYDRLPRASRTNRCFDAFNRNPNANPDSWGDADYPESRKT